MLLYKFYIYSMSTLNKSPKRDFLLSFLNNRADKVQLQVVTLLGTKIQSHIVCIIIHIIHKHCFLTRWV